MKSDLSTSELWQIFFADRGDKIAAELTVRHMELVNNLVYKVMPGTAILKLFSRDDLISVGAIGLHTAVLTFDPSKGPFIPYALIKINGSLIDFSRAVTRASRDRKKLIWKLDKLVQIKAGNFTDNEACEYLGISWLKYQNLIINATMPIYSARDEYTCDENCLVDLICDESENQEAKMERESMHKALTSAICRLPHQYAIILIAYFYEETTLRQIGELLGIGESAVSQKKTRAVKMLKKIIITHRLI